MSNEIGAARGQRDVLHTVVGKDADEERELQALRRQIADACAGVMAQILKEAKT